MVSGTHLAPEFGFTVKQIEREGFAVADRVEMLLASDSPAGIAKSMGLGTISFADCYARKPPDLLFITGDRFEMHAAAIAALPFKIPIAHLHGGEVTAGAIDEALRHSMTKLSHLHFTATADAGQRVIQLGEEPWRVTVSGAPSLDNVHALARLDSTALTRRLGIDLEPPPLLVTFHPVTLQHERTASHIDEVLAALNTIEMPVIFTLPNADTSGRIIHERIAAYLGIHENAQIRDDLGTEAYFSLMALAAAMVGNSSSGIIEAASFRLPVVNFGDRQAGRLRARNVIDAPPDRAAIAAAIRRACSTTFRSSLAGLVNPYGRGNAAAVIVDRLRGVVLDETLLVKRFHDLPCASMRYD
jgi:UDP-hydrolysing UDP-N-acetyl-D-glucosamine 2-epimerase